VAGVEVAVGPEDEAAGLRVRDAVGARHDRIAGECLSRMRMAAALP
jgi:hypothetical protein